MTSTRSSDPSHLFGLAGPTSLRLNRMDLPCSRCFLWLHATVLSDPGEFDHRQFQRSDVDAAFAESRPARHSQDSRNPFHAGDDFRGFLVHTSATVCQLARPLHGSDRLPSQRGFYIRAFSGLVALPAAGYNYNSDWTPLLAGLSPARMAASLAAPTPSS